MSLIAHRIAGEFRAEPLDSSSSCSRMDEEHGDEDMLINFSASGQIRRQSGARTRCGAVGMSVAVIAAALAAVTTARATTTVNIGAMQDNTIYDDGTGATSNGKGQSCFVGNNAMGLVRRALLKFDLSAIPAGSTVTSATLRLYMAQTTAGPTNVTAHNLLASWGEGTSLPGGNGGEGTDATTNDATWVHRFYNTTNWTTQGGQFVAGASATTSVGGDGFYNWTSAQMIADVQGWVNSPSSNFGWIMRGNEAASHTSKRFSTRENPVASERPLLIVTYTPPCNADLNDDNTIGVPDLLGVINAWGPCSMPCPPRCAADMNRDCIVGVPDLLAVINTWGPCP